MKRSIMIPTLVTATFAFVGCATAQAPSAPAHDHAHDHTAPAHAAQGGAAARGFELPASAGEGQPREVRVLMDEPALKLATIVLRKGTVLPDHKTAVPVTIVALQGSGTVIAAGERLFVDPTHAVFLAPNVQHAVEPAAGTDLVLLVHHLGRAEEPH